MPKIEETERLQPEEKTLLTQVVHQDNAVMVSENPIVKGYLGLVFVKHVRPHFGQTGLEFAQNVRINAAAGLMYVRAFDKMLIVPGFDRGKYDFLVSDQMDLVPQPTRMAYRFTFMAEDEFRRVTTFFAKWQKYKGVSAEQVTYLDKIGRADRLEFAAQLWAICQRVSRAHPDFFSSERETKTLIPTLRMTGVYASLRVGQ